ncbi:kinase-like protein [Thozetella sp. PMI_491]|nr:kinase-like protein [Thozetella sp. PMI_491]
MSQLSLDAPLGIVPSPPALAEDSPHHRHHHSHRLERASERLLARVAEWLQHEKAKKETRKARKVPARRKSPPSEDSAGAVPGVRPRAYSIDSQDSDVSLDQLQRIIDDSMAALGLSQVPYYSTKHGRRRSKSHGLSLTRTASSDTDYFDGDVVVPSCDGFLDNSKAMSYSGGKSAADDGASISGKKEEKEKKAWLDFRNEIIRLAHTLRLKGWRRVPLDAGETISVQRLSGALTNAVYVVTPPHGLETTSDGKKAPKKVLLRVYGPQAEHLIDRENELSVLRRLARKKIGPRLLGTFTNGRFEQFFNATTLTSLTMRDPDTSKLIAKRMREMHDGIELLEEEKDAGPNVWRNWDRWLDKVEKTIAYCDQRISCGRPATIRRPLDIWKTRGFVCGVEWPRFKAMVEKYRKFVEDYYGGSAKIRDKLVFAHNDTQYGNILRVRPDDQKSPLLQPANEHKQLVVIDFEYAAANARGLEFANHFTEWMYNYHDPIAPYACHPNRYPTPEEQYRFIKSYVEHRPHFPHGGSTPNLTPLATPLATPSGTPGLLCTSSSSSIVDFMLDAREPRGGWNEEDTRRDEAIDANVKELMEEARLWRVANSAMWIAWGIVQAKVPSLEAMPESENGPVQYGAGEEEEEEDEEFDNLGYAQERAMFFWGDCVLMGLIGLDELPKELVENLKLVKY